MASRLVHLKALILFVAVAGGWVAFALGSEPGCPSHSVVLVIAGDRVDLSEPGQDDFPGGAPDLPGLSAPATEAHFACDWLAAEAFLWPVGGFLQQSAGLYIRGP
jgi:hypothetical protein